MRDCEVKLNIFLAKIDFNILPLRSYNVLIGMDWLEQHHVMIDFLHKSSFCTYSQGNQTNIQGIPKKVSIRQISTLQEKKCIMKGCKLFAVNIQDVEAERKQQIEDFSVLMEFKDVFPKKILGLPPKWDLDFL